MTTFVANEHFLSLLTNNLNLFVTDCNQIL